MTSCRSVLFLTFLVLLVAATLSLAPAHTAPKPVTITELIPLVSSRKEFKIIDGKDRGRLVPLIFQADPADEKKWQLSFGDYGRIFLRSSSGSLIMDRLELFNSKNYIVYDPPLQVLSAADAFAAGVSQTGYKMYSAESGKLKRAGIITHSVRRISPSRFSTPAGLLDGYQIELEHRMDMEYYSQLLLTVDLGCTLDEGLIYGSAHYRLKKLGGLLTETKSSAAALFRR